MSEPCLIVCEKTGRWATALRRVVRDLPLRIVETRGLVACSQELEQNPTSLIALEFVPERLESVLRWLLELREHFRYARAVVIVRQGAREYEWVLREAGAVHVLFPPHAWEPMARLAARHVRQAPVEDADIYQSIWRRLPLGS
jgi:hypothetical protein